MLPTLRSVLELPELQRGYPEVLAGDDQLERTVRWVHVLELREVSGLLQGGELILSTGIGLPDDPQGLREYVAELAAAGVAGLVIELGHRWERLPPAIVDAAGRHRLPLVVMHSPVKFVAITEAVHAEVINTQYSALKMSEQMHEAFTRLGVEGADVTEILEAAARWASVPVVLENAAHRVLAAAVAGRDRQVVLGDWENRSRRALRGDSPERWLVTPVGARGEHWGRLVLLPDGEPSSRQRMVLERAASALALNRLIERDQQSLERLAHRSVLTEIVTGRRTVEDLHAQTEALGVPTEGRAITGVVVHSPGADPVQVESDATVVAAALDRAGVRALVAPFGPGLGILLISADTTGARRPLTDVARRVHSALRPARVLIGVGATVTSLREAGSSLREAALVAEAGEGAPQERPYLTLADIRLRGLLALLRDDPRVQIFVERELGPLLQAPEPQRRDLHRTLQAYLAAGGNKSVAAERLHLSRPALYLRLRTLEKMLGVDLDDAESALSLHVAVTALDVFRAHRPAGTQDDALA